MENRDIRWIQRFNNFSKALAQLQKFVIKGENLNDLEKQGLIQAFEYNFELAWNLIKDYYEYQGSTNIQGSRDAFRLAFKLDLIKDGANWMQMIESRSKTSHTYNQETADEIATAILNTYYFLFIELHLVMEKIIVQSGEMDPKEK
jgi:nucleotidyltransferase substrate binding protein (TIGR01987 family)